MAVTNRQATRPASEILELRGGRSFVSAQEVVLGRPQQKEAHSLKVWASSKWIQCKAHRVGWGSWASK